MFDKYFLILNECLTSLGNSLILKDMLKEFLRTVTKKTSAISSIAVSRENFEIITTINKKSIVSDFTSFICDHKEQHFHIFKLEDETQLVILYLDSIIIFLRYGKDINDIEKLTNMLFSLDKKINSSINACKLFEENKNINETLELAILGANDGLWDWNIETNQVYFSPRWKSMLGYEDDELKNDFAEWKSRIHPDDKVETLNYVQDYIDGKIKHFNNIHRLKHKDGSWVWILDRGKATFEDGKIKKFVGFHTDITKQKKLEEELETRVQIEVIKNQKKDIMLKEQSRLAQLGEMISMIAHQWRQPLASIGSVALTLKLRIALNKYDINSKEDFDNFGQDLSTDMDEIEELVQHLTQTIDDFRDFYQPNKQAKVELIDIAIKKSVSLIDSQMKQRGIETQLKINTHNTIKLHENELLQVFLNILKNALDNFIEKDIQQPKLIIEAKDIENGGIEVNILDNGGGVSKDIISKIFDPYFSTKSEKNGTGLGLYMSKLIIEKHHNGELSVRNKDEGAEFHITLYP